MTMIEQYPPLPPELTVAPTRALPFDGYRDAHKGLRAELFAVTASAGQTDPSDREGRAALSAHVFDVVGFLISHSGHEDAHVLPLLQEHAPVLFDRNATDHAALDARLSRISERCGAITDATSSEHRARIHNLYLDLASFTSAYLAHQEFEERIVMPTLIDAIGVEGAVRMHDAIVHSIPPPEMAKSLALMIPAMNVEDRVEMLGGMRESAPAEVFEGIWGLVNSVLAPRDISAVACRLGL